MRYEIDQQLTGEPIHDGPGIKMYRGHLFSYLDALSCKNGARIASFEMFPQAMLVHHAITISEKQVIAG